MLVRQIVEALVEENTESRQLQDELDASFDEGKNQIVTSTTTKEEGASA
jgi:hypothetical protein